jgi:hypothetical protein
MRRLSKGLLAAAAIGLSTAGACGMFPHLLYGKRIAGQVVDAGTGMPIPGAYVSFFWESGIIPSGFTGHNPRTICYHAAGTVSNEQGRFDIAPWRKWSTYDVEATDPLAIVYASHYVPTQIVLRVGRTAPPTERSNERYALKAFAGTTEARMHMLFWGIANHDCSYGGDSQKSLYPMLRAIYDEARNTARTKDDEDTVQIIARFVARSAIAASPDKPRDEERAEKFIQEHLQ